MNSQKKYIIIIDDDGLTRWSIEKCLQSKFIVDTVKDWNEAEPLMNHQEYHLLITNFQLPRQNGLSNVKKAKKINPHIKTILLAANPSSVIDQMNKSEWVKPDLILDKIFDTEAFLINVESLLSKENSPIHIQQDPQ